MFGVDVVYGKPELAPFGFALTDPGDFANALMWLAFSVWGNEPLFSLLDSHFQGSLLSRKASHVLEKSCTRRDSDRLLKMLRQNGYSSDYAADILGSVREPRAVPLLIEAVLDRKSPGPSALSAVRPPTATSALRRITGQHFGDDPDRWRTWWENNKERLLEEKLQDR
jgi:hypothetical protein